MPIERDAVVWAFRLLLGREPESESVIDLHVSNARDETHLAETLLRSPEFSLNERFKHLVAVQNVMQPSQATGMLHIETSDVKVVLIGNCQIRVLGRLFQAMTGSIIASNILLRPDSCLPVSQAALSRDGMVRLMKGDSCTEALIYDSDLVLIHPFPESIETIKQRYPGVEKKLRIIPRIVFAGFHPDVAHVKYRGKFIHGALGQYQSALAFYAWAQGYSVDKAVALFSEDIFELLGYFDYWEASKNQLSREGHAAGLPLDHLIERWSRSDVWMHSTNHPKRFVLADIARAVLEREGIKVLPGADEWIWDDAGDCAIWPVYPEIASRLGRRGHYYFKAHRLSCPVDRPVLALDLPSFVHQSYGLFSKYPKGELSCARLDSSCYSDLTKLLKDCRIAKGTNTSTNKIGSSVATVSSSPYSDLPDYHFWRRVIEGVPGIEVDPMITPKFSVGHTAKIATAGSCFAQHVSRVLKKSGFNYFVVEKSPNLSAEEATRRNYGVFSARYGNLYTTRQLLQLFDRAYGRYKPIDTAWMRHDGRFVDPFRPLIEPDGFETLEALELDRREHFASIRFLMETLDVFVFTLGLTETWRNIQDGAIVPIVPEVVGCQLVSGKYEFVNLTSQEVVHDLMAFLEQLRCVNPQARAILTVSPVPLLATYERRHVLVSNTYSKAALRVAVDEVCRVDPMCDYFPAFEIITGNHTMGTYFEADKRSIRPAGVEQVMRVFLRHYLHAEKLLSDREIMRDLELANDVICDEKIIENQILAG